MSKEFFNVQAVQDALNTLFENCDLQPQAVTCRAQDSRGKIVAVAPRSPIDLPEFVRSTMDGYAVRAADTFGASQSLPAYLTLVGHVEMGKVADVDIQREQTAEIHTGGMLPPGADAVVMVEKTQKVSESEIEILAPVAPGENLVQVGEDVAAGDEILSAGHRIRPQDIGGLLAVGILDVEVARPPRVAILGSGDELIPPAETPQPGQIRDINSYTLAALFEEAGADVTLCGIAQDTPNALYEMAKAAFAENDMLVMTAGSSVSTRDLTRDTIQRLGKPGILQHGLAVKPGKPTLIGVCDNKPVIGLPGNPVSAFLVARQIVIPIIQKLLGETLRPAGMIQAILKDNIASTTGREDSVPVRLISENGQMMAEPVFGKSNLIYTLVNADGLVKVPLNSNGIKAGTPVEVSLF